MKITKIIRAKRGLASMHNERTFNALDNRIKKANVKGSTIQVNKPLTYQQYIDQYIQRG